MDTTRVLVQVVLVVVAAVLGNHPVVAVVVDGVAVVVEAHQITTHRDLEGFLAAVVAPRIVVAGAAVLVVVVAGGIIMVPLGRAVLAAVVAVVAMLDQVALLLVLEAQVS